MASAAHLNAARAKIADPARWTTGEAARDAEGLAAHSVSPGAVCWCAAGAFWAVGGEQGGIEHETLLDTALVLFNRDLVEVNDRLGHAAVLKVYDEAIARVESGRGAQPAGAA